MVEPAGKKRRSYNPRTLLFIVVGIAILAGAHFATRWSGEKPAEPVTVTSADIPVATGAEENVPPMDHSTMDHAAMNHGTTPPMDHAAMSHDMSNMDHSNMTDADRAAMGIPPGMSMEDAHNMGYMRHPPMPEEDYGEANVLPPEGRGKPEFAAPMEFSLAAPITPNKIYEVEEKKIEPAWIRNAAESDVPKDKPRIAIIIDDMGMDKRRTHQIMELPGPMTMSFLPYAGDLLRQTKYARIKGHEVMLHLPMAAIDPTLDGGPQVLNPDMAPDVFDKTLNSELIAFDGYVGINNHMGSKMTQDRAGMARLMQTLKKHGLLFVDSRTINNSVGADEAKKAGIPYASRDVFIDHDDTLESAVAALDQIEKQAVKNGLVVAIGHPKDNTIKALAEWIPTLAAKGIYLIPISEAVTVPEGGNETTLIPVDTK